MKITKHIREAIHVAENLGCEILDVTHTAKCHIRLRLRRGAHEFCAILPGTPGDKHRYLRNVRADISRTISHPSPIRNESPRA
jgi:hypothetical protein